MLAYICCYFADPYGLREISDPMFPYKHTQLDVSVQAKCQIGSIAKDPVRNKMLWVVMQIHWKDWPIFANEWDDPAAPKEEKPSDNGARGRLANHSDIKIRLMPMPVIYPDCNECTGAQDPSDRPSRSICLCWLTFPHASPGLDDEFKVGNKMAMVKAVFSKTLERVGGSAIESADRAAYSRATTPLSGVPPASFRTTAAA